nr:MAG TPA: Protein of unknown function (DUF551) [Caudoviricetes sp.]
MTRTVRPRHSQKSSSQKTASAHSAPCISDLFMVTSHLATRTKPARNAHRPPRRNRRASVTRCLTSNRTSQGLTMSTISTEQAKDLRNAFECWQQDYDPVEDKEQYEMFGLGVVAMDELLALRKEREKEESAVCPKCGNTGLADSGGVQPWGEPILIECDCTAPPAPGADDDSLPYDPQIAEYEQMMEAEQAQADTTSQQFESLAGKVVGGSDGFECTPVADLYELLTKCGECYDYTTSAKVAAAWIKDGYSAREYVKLDRLQEAMTHGSSGEPDGWIPCSERMPDTYVNVLLTDEHGDTCIGQLESFEDAHFYISSSIHRYKATHWQPLPEPPCK